MAREIGHPPSEAAKMSKRKPRMPAWREQLFRLIYRNTRHAADYFNLPPERVVELGVQLELSP